MFGVGFCYLCTTPQDKIINGTGVWLTVKLFATLVNFSCFLLLLIIFKNNFFEKFFQECHLSVKQIGSRSGSTFSNLFAKVVSKGKAGLFPAIWKKALGQNWEK